MARKQQNAESNFFSNIEQIIGHLERRKLADVFRVISFEPFEEYPMHNHERIEINYLKRGSCIMRINEESITFREGELMIIGSDIAHSFQAGSAGCTLLQLEFLPDVFMSFTSNMTDGDDFEIDTCDIFARDNSVIKIINNVAIIRSIERVVTEMTTRNRYYKYLVIMYYAELLILIYRHLYESYTLLRGNESMTRALKYMTMNYRKELTISSVAAHAKISERYLRKLFTQYMNLSPVDYLNQIRINKAIELLRITDLSVKEVCFECGFRSPQYFCRVFKQQVGVSPKTITRDSTI